MIESETVPLTTILTEAQRFDSTSFLYLPFAEVWTLATKGAVLRESSTECVPKFAGENGLAYALPIATVQEIVENARAQRASLSANQLLEAFLFYYDNDAFIELS